MGGKIKKIKKIKKVKKNKKIKKKTLRKTFTSSWLESGNGKDT